MQEIDTDNTPTTSGGQQQALSWEDCLLDSEDQIDRAAQGAGQDF